MMSCRTGPLRVGRAFARLFYLSGLVQGGGPRVARRCNPGHRPGLDDRIVTTGIHATKWPLSAQEARPAGHGVYPVAGVRLAVLAVQAIRRMRGGAQSQLMLGADGKLWVVKFQNNPQDVRVLANELIATRLAAAVGLTVPASDVVEVTEWLVANTLDMFVELPRGQRQRYVSGLQFGSQFVGGLMPGQVVDYLPEQQLDEVRNLAEFAGMLCVDKWAGNCNGRQAVFERKPRERKYRATFIDQGFCFNAGEWTFPDSPLRGVYQRNQVYASVTGWESFEPWLSRVEAMEAGALWAIAEAVPPEWYGGDTAVIERLMEQMLRRRSKVRELIGEFRDSDREPFPMWASGKTIVVPRQFEEASGVGKFVM